MSDIKISLREREMYLANSVNLMLDNQWDKKSLGLKADEKGIYVIFTNMPKHIIHVGKTRGAKMDFKTRLYRHATKSASQNSKVYKKSKELSNKYGVPIKVALIDSNDVRSHFTFHSVDFDEAAMIDILEQVLIHYLKPEPL